MSATADGYQFKEILVEMREHTLKRLANPHLGSYAPSSRLAESFRRLRSLPLPVSNADELDDAVKKIKETGNSGATNTAENSKNGITEASNTFKGNQNESDFKKKMEESRQKALSDSADSINKTYDKAEELGEQLSPSQQNFLVNVMNTLNDGFHEIWNKISNFVLDAVKAVVDFIKEAWKKIEDFFGGVFSDIKSIF